MKLIVLLLCLLMEKSVNSEKWRNFAWCDSYLQQCQRLLNRLPWQANAIVALIAIVAPLLLVLALLQWGLSLFFYGLLSLLFALLLLWYCLGPGHLGEELDAYIAAAEQPQPDNTSHTNTRAQVIIANHADENQSMPLARRITQSIFWQAHERTFAVIFWFCLLGPIGAFAYRLIWLLDKKIGMDSELAYLVGTVHHCHGLLAWLPSRLTALTYSLVGDFIPGFRCLQKTLWQSGQSRALLVACGECAMGKAEQGQVEFESVDTSASIDDNRQALALTQRALVLWIMIIAITTIALTL